MSKVVKITAVKHNVVGVGASGKEYVFSSIDYLSPEGTPKTQKVMRSMMMSNPDLASTMNKLKEGDTVRFDYTKIEGKQFADLSNISLTDEPLSVPYNSRRAANSGSFSGDSGVSAQVGGLMHDAVALVVGSKKQDLKAALFELIDLSNEAKEYAKSGKPAAMQSAPVAPKAHKEVVLDNDADWE